jgi:mucin-19
MATPYVISSDLVSAYPAKSLEIAQYIDGFKADLALVQNAQTGTTYSFVAADFTKLVTLSNASPVAVTLPLEATVPWPAGTTLRMLNQGAGLVTVAGDVGVTINGTPLTLAQYKGANLIKTGTDTWSFLPFSSGVGAADFSDAATGTYSGFKYKTFTGSSTLTVTKAGFADLVVIGGGASGGRSSDAGGGGGGGAGGALIVTDAYLPVGTLTVTVGAGGANPGAANTQGYNGNTTGVGPFFSSGGGGGAAYGGGAGLFVGDGASGGGGQNNTQQAGGSGVSGLGFAGGTGATSSAGGGGGGAVGGNPAGSTGGAGGAGATTTIAGTTPTGAYVAGTFTFSGGGGGGGTVTGGAGGSGGGGIGAANTGAAGNGSANTGGGGGGRNGSPVGLGGSGLVIVRVAV